VKTEVVAPQAVAGLGPRRPGRAYQPEEVRAAGRRGLGRGALIDHKVAG
jgi:hypothetical protein